MATIVVGVDGSPVAVSAVRFAVDEARRRGAEVKAVHAWQVPTPFYDAGFALAADLPEEAERIAREVLDEALARASVEGSGVSVTPIVRAGQPAEVLCAESRGADLLVVGSRGLGGFRGLLLGSVGQQCVQHAPCPVVVVPKDATSAAAA